MNSSLSSILAGVSLLGLFFIWYVLFFTKEAEVNPKVLTITKKELVAIQNGSQIYMILNNEGEDIPFFLELEKSEATNSPGVPSPPDGEQLFFESENIPPQ